MTHETEGTQLKPEVPHHHARVVAARDELLHVRVEAHRGNGILVTAEAPFERGRVRREVGASHRFIPANAPWRTYRALSSFAVVRGC